VGGHSTFLSREEHRVAAGALFYKAEGEKHCIMRKAILDNEKSTPLAGVRLAIAIKKVFYIQSMSSIQNSNKGPDMLLRSRVEP
jgi:hypothetical protein